MLLKMPLLPVLRVVALRGRGDRTRVTAGGLKGSFYEGMLARLDEAQGQGETPARQHHVRQRAK